MHRSSRDRIALPALSLAVALMAAPAHADDEDDGDAAQRAAAQTLFDQGIELFERGEFEPACDKLEASLALYRGLGTQGKLAECYREIGRTASAWALYRKVAVLAKRRGDELREQVARDRAAALEPELAFLTIEVGADGPPGLEVRRNGDPVPAELLGSAVAVDAGTHTVEVSAPGHEPWSRAVAVEDGDERAVTVPPLVKPRSPLELAGVSGMGAGAVVVVVGLGLGARAYGRNQDSLALEAPGGICAGPCTELRNAALSDSWWSTGLVLAGLAVGAGGFYLWRTHRRHGAARERAVSVVPALTRERAGVLVRGSF